MLSILRLQIEELLRASVHEVLHDFSIPLDDVELEKTKEKMHGDFSCNIALRLAKQLKKNPISVAEALCVLVDQKINALPLRSLMTKVEVKKPGFINFYLSPKAFFPVLKEIFKDNARYGASKRGQGQKVQIEFVSANPTGPLTVAHARQAAVGDALGNILKFLGFTVTKEYYINDEGNQIKILGQSVKFRAKEILGETVSFPEDYYQGGYIKDMAKDLMTEQSITSPDALDQLSDKTFEAFGVRYLMDLIRKDLNDFGVHFDVWTSQAKVATVENIEKALKVIEQKGYIYSQDGALWFKSTALGDDKDRVVKKSDGLYTYLAPDIAYHKDKFERGFHWVINILGPDHHGYIPRLKAAVQALGHDSKQIDVLIVQLATLFRKGQPISMSTRKGEFISLREVMDEVGVDAARFFFLLRHINAHLEFDLELAKEQTMENPVYYIQYAHARINSIFVKAKEAGIGVASNDFSLLCEEEEIDLIKKMASFEDALSICLHQIDPFALLSYLIDLAGAFHRFYDKYKVIQEDQKLSSQRLALVMAAKIVFANGLILLGISVPEKM
jgi:arginyl-tRNA synthetase